jgi:transaldolase
MKDNPLKKLETLGQSIWLDYIRRDLIASGELRRLIEEDGLRGMTSNPSIFEKAIAESYIYDQDIRDMALKKKDVKAIKHLSPALSPSSRPSGTGSIFTRTSIFW